MFILTLQNKENMKKFNEWLIENHPEIIEEGWGKNLVTAGLLGAAALGVMPKSTYAADVNNRRAQEQQNKDEDIIEKGGMVYIKGTVSPKDNSSKAMFDAISQAEMNIQMKAAKYFQSKGGKPGFVPPGYKTIKNKGDVLSGKSDRIVWAWKIPVE
jgi:hypothetical protein